MSKKRQVTSRAPPTNLPMPLIYPLAQIGARWIVGTDMGQIATIPTQDLPKVKQGPVAHVPLGLPVVRYIDPRSALIHQVELKNLVIDKRWELAAAFDKETRMWVVAGEARRFNGE